jgi:hypothetical protein
MKLVTSYAGHESLWYQRRLFSLTLLSCLLQMTKCHSLPTLASAEEMSSKGLSDLTSTTAEFLETIQQYFNEDRTSQAAPPSSAQSGEEEYSVELSIEQQRKFLSPSLSVPPSLAPSAAPEPLDVVHQMVSLALRWISHEMKFVLDLLADDMSWSPLLQQKYALRYIYYLTFLVPPPLSSPVRPSRSLASGVKALKFPLSGRHRRRH